MMLELADDLKPEIDKQTDLYVDPGKTNVLPTAMPQITVQSFGTRSTKKYCS